jgi:hypothetical protein
MIRNAPPHGSRPVLVVTVVGRVRAARVVSLTETEPHPAGSGSQAQGDYAPSDNAVLSLVKNWLEAVAKMSYRPRAPRRNLRHDHRFADPTDPGPE